MRIRANFSIVGDKGISDRFYAIETVNGNPRKQETRRIDDAVTRVVDRVIKQRDADKLDGRIRYEGYSVIRGESVFTSAMWGKRG